MLRSSIGKSGAPHLSAGSGDPDEEAKSEDEVRRIIEDSLSEEDSLSPNVRRKNQTQPNLVNQKQLQGRLP